MPKTKQEIMNDLKLPENPTQDNYKQYADKLLGYIAEMNAADDSAEKTAESKMIKECVDNSIASLVPHEVIDERTHKKFLGVYEELLKAKMREQISAGQMIDGYGQKIKNGEIPSADYAADEEKVVKGISKDLFIVHEKEEMKKINNTSYAFNALMKASEHSSVVTDYEDVARNGERTMKHGKLSLHASAKKQKEKIIDKLIDTEYNEHPEYRRFTTDEAGDFSIKNKNGFAVNQNYKPGHSYFSKLPQEIKDINASKDAAGLEKVKEKYETKKDAYEKYVENTGVLAKRARQMLEEMDAISRTDGKEDSEEYEAMRDALVAVSNLDQPSALFGGGAVIVPEKVSKAIENLKTTSAAYEAKNKSVFRKGHEFGQDRLNMSRRCQNMAELAAPIMDHTQYGIEGTCSCVDRVKELDVKLARIEKAREKKGYEPFKPHVKKQPTVSERLESAKANAAEASKGVKGGSSEYDKAVKQFDKVRKLYEQFNKIKEDKELDPNQRRRELKKLSEDLKKSETTINKYITRKKDLGQIQAGSTVDMKSQKRINSIREGLTAVNAFTKEINAYNEELYLSEESLEAQAVGKMIDDNEMIAQQNTVAAGNEAKALELAVQGEKEGSYMRLSAQVAKDAYATLNRISTMNKDVPLAPEDKERALVAMGMVSYYGMISRLDKDHFNDSYIADHDVLRQHLVDFMDSVEFRRVLGDGSDINHEQVQDFIADPTSVTEKMIQNREKVRELNAQVNEQQVKQNEQPQLEAHVQRNSTL